MYKAFFGLQEKPFNLTPDPRYLYLSPQHKAALDHLLFGINERKGFITITGGIGTGKTTLCRALLGQMDSKIKTALIFNAFVSDRELLRGICQEFGLEEGQGQETRKGYIDALNRFLLETFTQGDNAVLLIDDAQNLSPEVLEQIRMLSNLETEKEKLVQIVLFGQSELKQLLSGPHLRQLNERITVRYDLKPLNAKDIRGYIEHRLIVAGGRGNPRFTSGAIRELFQYSGGNPRRINAVCDRALLLAYVREKLVITREMVKKAIHDIQGDFQVSRAAIPNRLIRLASMIIIMLVMVIAAGFVGLSLQDKFLAAFDRKPEETALKADIIIQPEEEIKAPASLFLDEQKSLAGLFAYYRQQNSEGQEDQQQLSLFTQDMEPEYYLLLKKPFRVTVRNEEGPDQPAKYLLTQRLTDQGAVVIDAEGKERVIDREFLLSCWGGKISWVYRPGNHAHFTRGRAGAEIFPLQRMLREIGYEVELNGRFDEKMRLEVLQFQRDFNLTADGIVGPQTYALLYQMTGENEHH